MSSTNINQEDKTQNAEKKRGSQPRLSGRLFTKIYKTPDGQNYQKLVLWDFVAKKDDE